MTNTDINKNIDLFNSTFPRSKLFNQLSALTKTGGFALDILMFPPPPQIQGDKKELKSQKTNRQEFQLFFKEKGDKITLTEKLLITGIPEQLASLLHQTGKGCGFNFNAGPQSELFSILSIFKAGKPIDSAILDEIICLFSLFGSGCLSDCIRVHITFAENKIRQIIPIQIPQSPYIQKAPPFCMDQLHQLQNLYKSLHLLDGKSKEEIQTGLTYLETIQNQRDPYIKLNLIASAMDYFIQSPSSVGGTSNQDPQCYFINMCLELTGKLKMEESNQNLFSEFFKMGVNVQMEKQYLKKNIPQKESLLREMESFYRQFLAKAINDVNFLKQTLPKLKAAQKKELKKQKIKKQWRKFPGRYIARLFEES